MEEQDLEEQIMEEQVNDSMPEAEQDLEEQIIINALKMALETEQDLDEQMIINAFKMAFKKNPDYAWSWHCKLAMSAHDEFGLDKPAANRMAARFMKSCFDIDTKEGYAKEK